MDDDYGKVRIVLEAKDYSITRDERGFDVIMMDGFASTTSSGDPMLVHKVYDVLIPPEAVGEELKLEIVSAEVQVLDGTFEIPPVGAIAPVAGERELAADEVGIEYWGEGKSITDGINLDVYEKDADYPENFLELLPPSQMRKWKFARLDYTPFTYNPVSKKLTVIKSAVVEISYGVSPAPLDRTLLTDTVMDDVAAGMFVNYEEGRLWYEEAAMKAAIKMEAKPLAAADYVIITTNAIVANSAKLNAFKSHKESLGYSVLVVTETDFLGLTGQAPNQRAEKIRQWLKENYLTKGIKYVLLIGDPRPFESGEGDVPMKMCWPRYSEDSHREAPTDYFYADLTGNWDRNANQIYGEWVDFTASGGVDLTAEVYVGRIPVYDAGYSTLDAILQKIIDYETSLSTGWRKSALLPMSFLDGGVYGYSATDYGALGEEMKVKFLDGAGFSCYRMYQQGSGACGVNSAYSSEAELRGGTGVRDRWAGDDYGIVSWAGHGSPVHTEVGYSKPAVCYDGALFVSSYASSLNDLRPSFVYHGSCSNAHPETKDNVAYSVLKKGGISTLGSTRVCWYYLGESFGGFEGSPSVGGIGFGYVKRIVQELPGADALYQLKQTIYPSGSAMLMNWYDFNLYGDPALNIRLEVPNSPPETPDRPVGPNSGKIGLLYSYSAVSDDPDGDQLRYVFDWGDATTSQTGFVDSGTTGSLTHLWNVEGVYNIRVRAEDVRGATSEWSEPLEVSIFQGVNRVAGVRRSPIFGF
ncbi:C25 family cysteine peptidase [Methanotrichaceae archaeon M04Ac]|uniref:C25 family cysteine peptidase n=1 Tax=Candidatus Methanocrinis alkalitolerans TaxID=3033395 RepID=A0ABT5XGI0_9EURY|nr:C25 family cysteine peptidase [Candidatus Methanocrinis alkalitolerans]MDF0593836.1 C25 family cysteine peptidase [Candidatus Methanocrinis alkalitolerans]